MDTQRFITSASPNRILTQSILPAYAARWRGVAAPDLVDELGSAPALNRMRMASALPARAA